MPWTFPLLRTVPAFCLFYKKIPAQRLTNTYFPAIILLVRYGWLAQLVRALRSHRRGRGFESPILHHTVRTRTQFSMRKGSGTFFVYRKFCGRTTQSVKRAKAGYHYDGGILPFALRNQVRFVRTWSPSIWRIDGNCCVRAYREPVHLWQGVTH